MQKKWYFTPVSESSQQGYNFFCQGCHFLPSHSIHLVSCIIDWPRRKRKRSNVAILSSGVEKPLRGGKRVIFQFFPHEKSTLARIIKITFACRIIFFPLAMNTIFPKDIKLCCISLHTWEESRHICEINLRKKIFLANIFLSLLGNEAKVYPVWLYLGSFSLWPFVIFEEENVFRAWWGKK